MATTFEPKQFGKYVLLEKLAVGGMAEIYKAKTYGAEGFEKLLAIKRILPHAAADKEFISMLIDEAKLSVLLSHANIVQVYDLGKVADDYFISMEFIHGVNLRDILYHLREKNKKMPTDLAVFVASEVCKGLDYAHRKTDSNNQPLGLVHRDISPQNILISFEGEVKIVDFGIAKAAMNISHTMAGILKGKIAYMSPEQAMGKSVDGRTDIFSLGILLYEALTGKKLYTGESQFEVLKKIRTTRIDVAKLPESIPEPLKVVLAKALAYRLEDRYPTAGDMQIALTKYLYATFTGFSPRKLALFVQGLFQDQVGREAREEDKEKVLEAQTGSVSVAQGATQENIVHRETTPGRSQTVDETHPVSAVKSITVSEMAEASKKKFPLLLPLSAALLLTVGFFAWKFFTLSPGPNLSMLGGTLQVTSQPEGAAIFLNGQSTPYKTPAILENLELHKNIQVALTLDQYGRQEKTVKLENVEPLPLQITLTKNALGSLNIISEPVGAAILLNGVATGKTTPAILEDLNLNTEYKISISKPGYQDFEQPVTLMNTSPQKLMASLNPIVTEPPPVPTPPVQPPPPPPPAEIAGSVEVKSNPAGARVFLNGKDTGKTTPALLENLKEGRYTIRLSKDNFQIANRAVNIAASKQYSVEERLAEIKKPVETPKPPPEKPAEKPKPEERPVTRGGEGTIRVTSSPSGADVFVNGEHQGTTPMTVKAPSGSVRILVNKGTEALACKKLVSLGPGETASVDCQMGALFGKVDINSTPPRADVIFDGKKVGGKTPLTIEKVNREREHTLRLELDGYRSWEKTFGMEDRETKAFNVDLEK